MRPDIYQAVTQGESDGAKNYHYSWGILTPSHYYYASGDILRQILEVLAIGTATTTKNF